MRKRFVDRIGKSGKRLLNVVAIGDEAYANLLERVAKCNEATPGVNLTPRQWLEGCILGSIDFEDED